MKAGVVLEIRQGCAVVLDGGGRFRTVPAQPAWRPGDVVRLPGPRRHAGWAAGLAACLVLALLGAGGFLWLHPASLVSLDVNPSVELVVNRFDRVVRVRAMNEEGGQLLGAEGVRGKTTAAALAALLGSDFMQPYLAQQGAVTLTMESGRAGAEAQLSSLAGAVAGDGVRVTCHSVDADLVEAAHSHGVTAGKYLALLDLQAADPAIDISDYAHCGIDEIEEQADRCHAAAQSGTGAPGSGCDDHHHSHD